MTKAEMLAHYIREDEAECHLQDVSHGNAASARFVALLLDVADYLETVPDDDLRIVRMNRAHYFDSNVCVPGHEGQRFIEDSDVAGVAAFLDGLAAAAELDEAAWNSGAVPPERQYLGWNGTTGTHTAQFDVRWGHPDRWDDV